MKLIRPEQLKRRLLVCVLVIFGFGSALASVVSVYVVGLDQLVALGGIGVSAVLTILAAVIHDVDEAISGEESPAPLPKPDSVGAQIIHFPVVKRLR